MNEIAERSQKSSPWDEDAKIIGGRIREEGLDNFITWPTIQKTMYVGEHRVTVEEAKIVLDPIDVDYHRWLAAVRDDFKHGETPMSLYPFTCGNLIHQAYHLRSWEKRVGVTVKDLHSIVEFGGGYGAMCRVAAQSGFRGEYCIIDLPEMVTIQKHYLKDVEGVDLSFIEVENETFALPPDDIDLVIACYSLSEVSPEMRNAIFWTTYPKHVLIAHQNTWEQRDVVQEFDHFMKMNVPEYNWIIVDNQFYKGHRYVYGVRNERR